MWVGNSDIIFVGLVGWLVYGVQRHFQQYFSYILAIVLLVEEIGVYGWNHRPVASHWQTLTHNVLYIDSVLEIGFISASCP
jgi:hypothetical protein